MKINWGEPQRTGRKLGPAPAARGAGLSPARAVVLARLAERAEPRTVAALGEATGLHANTVREHLDALVEAGLAIRERAPAAGRGRPAWLYAPSDAGTSPDSEYAGLASALAAHLQRTSNAPRHDAVAAGAAWGRELAEEDLASRPDDSAAGRVQARRDVVRLLDKLGFAPSPDNRTSVVKLTRCPLLQAANRYPDIICGVHLGIVRGALEIYGGEVDRSELTAFAEPGACRLDLLARTHQP